LISVGGPASGVQPPAHDAVSPGARPCAVLLRRGCGVSPAARSTGCVPPVRLPPFSGGAVCRGPGLAVRLRRCCSRVGVPALGCAALMRPRSAGSPLAVCCCGHQVPWPVRQLKSPRYRGLSILYSCLPMLLPARRPNISAASISLVNLRFSFLYILVQFKT
jgi:hypothetical protein